MKKLVYLLALVFAAALPAAADPQAEVSFDLFYNSLAPYGAWISVDGGTYAWQPANMGSGWRPYYDGHWVWTDDGWYWDSEEPWAWATYHYGRWYDDDEYGWVWVPGYDWAPAWVDWRFGDGVMGWAPLGPYALFSIGWGVHYSRPWVTPVSYWTFVDCRYAAMPVRRYAYRFDENSRWFGRTRGAGSIGTDGRRIFTRGPEPAYVERTGNIRLQRATIHDVPDRASADRFRGNARDQIGVYRPRFDTNPSRAAEIRPPNVRETPRPLSMDRHSTGDPRQGDNVIQRAPDSRGRAVDRQSERKAIEERAPRAPGQDFNRNPRSSQMQRSSQPERTMRRPDAAPNVGSGDRGFRPPSAPSGRPAPGGNRGGDGGGRRGGGRR